VTVGGIEAGGTKWICAVGSDPSAVEAIASFPTEDPAATIDAAAGFFRDFPDITAIGVGSFGPVDLDECSPRFGTITTTPKPGWANTKLVSMLAERLQVPVSIDTDVNAAALGEHRWGAAKGLDTFCYVTIGTGVGGGGMVRGQLMHGLLHPEFGHMRIPHDRAQDPFTGSCPFHGDCLEGLASGGALRERYGIPAEEITDQVAWRLEAEYIALGLVNVVSIVSPQRIVIGGGVMKERSLLPLVRERLADLAGGYFESPALHDEIDGFVVPPALGDHAGVFGALELARTATAGRLTLPSAAP
jgi:fructokinase